MTRSVGVVVPAYRPDPEVLSVYVRAIDEQVDPETIRIELDAATDGIRATLSALPATVNAVPDRRGKGAAITAGFEALDTDVYAFADADGSTPVDSIADVIAPVREGRADLAVGSRRHPDSIIESHQSRLRRRLGDGFAWTARRLLGIDLHDFQCGAKAIDAGAWAAVRDDLYEAGFAWDVELIGLTAAAGRRIVEVPVTWEDKPDSTVSPGSAALELGTALIRTRIRAKRRRGSRLHAALESDGIALVDRIAAERTDE